MIQLLSPCAICGRSTLWRHRRPGAPWICGVCVTPELEPHEVEWPDAFPITEGSP